MRRSPLVSPQEPGQPPRWSSLRGGQAPVRRTRLGGSAAGESRKPLPPVSGKRRAENRVRKALAVKLFPEPPRCAVPWCTLMADAIHETQTRARTGGDITSPDIWAPACHGHNEELTREPRWGYSLGLLHHSWDDPAEPAPGALTREAAAELFARDSWCVHCGSTRSLRPHLRQEHGEHQGCSCGWLMLCPSCIALAAADPLGEAADEGLLIADASLAPYAVSVAVHLEDDRGGMRLWPLCDGRWGYAAPLGAIA